MSPKLSRKSLRKRKSSTSAAVSCDSNEDNWRPDCEEGDSDSSTSTTTTTTTTTTSSEVNRRRRMLKKNKKTTKVLVVGKKMCNSPLKSTPSRGIPEQILKPSEGLFICGLLSRCRQIAPLWLQAVSELRGLQRNQTDSHRVNMATFSDSWDQWHAVAQQMQIMRASDKTELLVNLLKKIFRELHSDTILWLLQCWLRTPQAELHRDRCVITKGDSKGRMKRIDGGRGCDKVWRLDTLVGILFHGLPLSSTDTHLLRHTCDEELCVRPQHLHFRANAVSVALVLSALQQTGYKILPPEHPQTPMPPPPVLVKEVPHCVEQHEPNDAPPTLSPAAVQLRANFKEHKPLPKKEKRRRLDMSSSPDVLDHFNDCVNLSSPFTVEEIHRLRTENLRPCHVASLRKYAMSRVDEEVLNLHPAISTAVRESYPQFMDRPCKTVGLRKRRHTASPARVVVETESQRAIAMSALLSLANSTTEGDEKTDVKDTDSLLSPGSRPSAFTIVPSAHIASSSNLPRQPAKKRLEARAEQFEKEDKFAGVTTMTTVRVLIPPTEEVSSVQQQTQVPVTDLAVVGEEDAELAAIMCSPPEVFIRGEEDAERPLRVVDRSLSEVAFHYSPSDSGFHPFRQLTGHFSSANSETYSPIVHLSRRSEDSPIFSSCLRDSLLLQPNESMTPDTIALLNYLFSTRSPSGLSHGSGQEYETLLSYLQQRHSSASSTPQLLITLQPSQQHPIPLSLMDGTEISNHSSVSSPSPECQQRTTTLHSEENVNHVEPTGHTE